MINTTYWMLTKMSCITYIYGRILGRIKKGLITVCFICNYMVRC